MASDPPPVKNPAKIQYMEDNPCSLEGSITLPNMAKSQEETPENSETLQAQSSSMTPTSRKQASTGKAFGNPALSFGARLNNVPTSISTRRRSPNEAQTYGNLMEASQHGQEEEKLQGKQMAPTSQMDEAPQAVQMGELCRPSIGCQDSRPPEVVRLPSLSRMLGDVSTTQRDTDIMSCQPNRRPVNPYAHRADEIGLRHSFPGVGVIDDFLTPPNWHPGQDPIGEAEAQELYDSARVSAKQNADDFTNSVEHDPNREERLEIFQEHWHAQRRMDESVLLERRKIHKAFLQFKREQAEPTSGLRKQPQQEASYQELFQRPLAGAPPLPFHNSLPVYHGVQQAQRPGNQWTRNDTPSPPLGAYHLHQRLQSMKGLHLPGSSPLSPSFLDPTLVPQTYEATIHYYNQNKMLLNQYDLENERYLATSTAKFNRQATPSSLISPNMAPSAGLGIGARSSMHYGCIPVDLAHASPPPVPRDLATQAQPRQTPGPMLCPKLGPMPGSLPRQMISGQYPANGQFGYGPSVNTQAKNAGAPQRGQSYLREVQNVESPPKSSHRKGKSNQVTSQDAEGYGENTGEAIANHLPISNSTIVQGPKEYQFVGSEVKPGRERKREEKANSAKLQLQDEIAAARLPTPKISDQALRAAGIMPKPKPASQLSGTTESSRKPKGRSRKAPFPAEGIRVSGAFGNALLAAGAKDTRQQPPIPALAALSSSKSGQATQLYARTAAPVPKPPQNVIDSTSGRDAPASNLIRYPDKPSSMTIMDGDRSHRIQGSPSERSSSSSLSPVSAGSSSVDSFDDPNDGDYGKRAGNGGRSATDTRKESGTPRKAPAVPTKRRSSIDAATGSAEKRSRQKH